MIDQLVSDILNLGAFWLDVPTLPAFPGRLQIYNVICRILGDDALDKIHSRMKPLYPKISHNLYSDGILPALPEEDYLVHVEWVTSFARAWLHQQIKSEPERRFYPLERRKRFSAVNLVEDGLRINDRPQTDEIGNLDDELNSVVASLVALTDGSEEPFDFAADLIDRALNGGLGGDDAFHSLEQLTHAVHLLRDETGCDEQPRFLLSLDPESSYGVCALQNSKGRHILICWRCGKSEHMARDCIAPVNPENPLPFRTIEKVGGHGTKRLNVSRNLVPKLTQKQPQQPGSSASNRTSTQRQNA